MNKSGLNQGKGTYRPPGRELKQRHTFPTPQQFLFARELVKNITQGVKGPMKRAAQVAYPGLSEGATCNIATRTSQHPAVREMVTKALESAGITPDLIAKKVKDHLDAKLQRFDLAGNLIEAGDNFPAQAKAIDTSLKLMDAYPAASGVAPNKPPSIHFHLEATPPAVLRFMVLNGRHPTAEERRQLEAASEAIDVTPEPTT